MAQAKAPKSME